MKSLTAIATVTSIVGLCVVGCVTDHYHKGDTDTGRDKVKVVEKFNTSSQLVERVTTRDPILRTQVDFFHHACGIDANYVKLNAKLTAGGTASFGADSIGYIVSSNDEAIASAMFTGASGLLESAANAYSTVTSGGTLNANNVATIQKYLNLLATCTNRTPTTASN